MPGIDHGNVDVHCPSAVPGDCAAEVAIDAVDSCRKALDRRVEGRLVAGRKRKDLAILGDEANPVVAFDGSKRCRREASRIAVQSVLVAVRDRRAVGAGVFGRDRSAVNRLLQNDDVLASDGSTPCATGEGRRDCIRFGQELTLPS